MFRIGKKGQVINGLTVAISAIAGLAIVLALTLYVLSAVGDEMEDNSEAQNATKSIVEKLGGAPVWIGILIVVIFASAVMYFWKVNNG